MSTATPDQHAHKQSQSRQEIQQMTEEIRKTAKRLCEDAVRERQRAQDIIEKAQIARQKRTVNSIHQ